jgi:hypothetical protein
MQQLGLHVVGTAYFYLALTRKQRHQSDNTILGHWQHTSNRDHECMAKDGKYKLYDVDQELNY